MDSYIKNSVNFVQSKIRGY